MWTTDRMRAGKYPLKRWWSAQRFWYSTLSRISDWTTPDFNLLTVARSQNQSHVVIRFSPLFGGDTDGLSVVIHYGASKIHAPTHNPVTIIQSFLWLLLVGILLVSNLLNQIAVLADFSSLLNSVWEQSTPLDTTSLLRKIVASLPQNLSGRPLVRNLANLSFRASLSKVGCR
jgi:hypothetical protein